MTQGGGEGVGRLRRLSESMSNREPRNASLHLRVSKPFARVCGRDPVALQLTIGMLESVRVRRAEDPSCITGDPLNGTIINK